MMLTEIIKTTATFSENKALIPTSGMVKLILASSYARNIGRIGILKNLKSNLMSQFLVDPGSLKLSVKQMLRSNYNSYIRDIDERNNMLCLALNSLE
jgi:hypothetical protein